MIPETGVMTFQWVYYNPKDPALGHSLESTVLKKMPHLIFRSSTMAPDQRPMLPAQSPLLLLLLLPRFWESVLKVQVLYAWLPLPCWPQEAVTRTPVCWFEISGVPHGWRNWLCPSGQFSSTRDSKEHILGVFPLTVRAVRKICVSGLLDLWVLLSCRWKI